ncbi:MAG: GNAT family N-acetyltransferase [Planctomycetota bacterium]|jgi:GNAT superfamily N-acetyltransferase
MRGRVRPVGDGEIEAWCACPYGTEHWIEGEREWLERWHTGSGSLFVYEDASGALLGKYDVAMERSGRWELWAPTVREDACAAPVMEALCAHMAAEARRRGVSFVEVILERAHRSFEVARRALEKAGFGLAETRVVFSRDLAELPPASAEIDFEEVSRRDPAEIAELRRAVGMRARFAPSDPDGIVALRKNRPVGLALFASGPGEDPFTLAHFGIVSSARGTGCGRALLLRTLHAAREGGSAVYVGSTEEGNEPMRRLFDSVGCEPLGSRLVLTLQLTATSQ